MGISIHYSGRIANKQTLPQLIEEVQEIATVNGWKFRVYERTFPTMHKTDTTDDSLTNDSTHDGYLYGISFTHEESEPVAVCFLSNGRMSSPMQLACWGHFEKESILTTETDEWDANGEHHSYTEELIVDQNQYNQRLYMCSTKTQFAGPDAHALIIGVLRYISNTYLSDFTLTDEGQFWETGDSALLQHNFHKTGFMINSFRTGISDTHRLPDEDIDSFIKRIATNIHKKKGEK